MSLVCAQDLPDELEGENSHAHENWQMERRNFRTINPDFDVILEQIPIHNTFCLTKLEQLLLFRKNPGQRVIMYNLIGTGHEIHDGFRVSPSFFMLEN